MASASQAQPPNEAADSSDSTAPQQLARNQSKVLRRLSYDGPSGSDGVERKVKVITQCLLFKGTLLGNGKKKDTYIMIATDLNKHYEGLFHGLLKEAAVSELWNKALKESVAQQNDKVEKHHLWYNGSQLREMSDWEKLLDEVYIEKKSHDDKTQAEKEKDEEAERDKQERLAAVFDRVDQRYLAGLKGQKDTDHPDDRDDDSPGGDTGIASGSSSAEKSRTGGSYSRGKKGGNQESAKGNSGLSPDPKPDKLTEACQKQAELSSTLASFTQQMLKRDREDNDQGGKGKEPRKMSELEKEEIEVKKTEAKSRKMEAASKLLDTYFKFKQSGVEMPAMLKRMVEGEDGADEA